MVNWVFDRLDNFQTVSSCPITVIRDDLTLEAGRFPIANLFWYWRWAEGWDKSGAHSWHCYNISDRPEKYVYCIGAWTDPSWWAGWEGNQHGHPCLFDLVPKEVMEDCRNNRALLVVDNLNEGFQTEQLYSFWHWSCDRHVIDPRNIVFMTSNLLDEEGYLEWAKKHTVSKLINVIGFCHLQYQQINCLSTTYRNVAWQDHAKAKSMNGKNIKLFNCLNRVRRPHREYLMLRLIDAGMHEQGLISHDRLEHHTWMHYGISEDVMQKAVDMLPLVVDDADFDNNKAMHINTDIYLRSWVSVVTETHAFDDPHSLFISEKPWKPVYALHPFMILGHKNTLETMRAMGYRTFSGLLDESYDSTDFVSRTSIIINNLSKLSVIRDKWGWLQECKEIVEHNKQVFLAQEIFNDPGILRFLDIYNKLGTR